MAYAEPDYEDPTRSRSSSVQRPQHVVMENLVEEAGNLEDSLVELPRPLRRVRKMYVAALSALMMAVAMGLATGYSAPATFDMKTNPKSPIKPSGEDITWIGSVLAIGAMLGGLVAGPVADKIGRHMTLMLNTIPFLIGWLSICFAKTVGVVIVGRVVCGVSCGVVSVVVPMYCVEISTPEVRGLLGSSFQGFMVIGNLLGVSIGSQVSWQYLALAGAAVSVLGMLCFYPMPESPRWLLSQNDKQGGMRSMSILQSGHVNVKEECEKILNDLKSQPRGLLTLKECLHPSVYKPALIAFTLMFFQQFSGSNAVLYYSSSIFADSKTAMEPRTSTIVLGVVQVVTTLVSNFVVDKAGRKLLLVLSGVIMFLSLLSLGIYYCVSFYNIEFQQNFSWIPLASLILFLIGFSSGYGPVPWLLAAEMVPLRARSTVGGIATFANGLCAFIVTKTFLELEALIHNFGTFWIYSVLSLLSCLFVLLVIPETKGKEIEDIIAYFCKSKNSHNQLK